ncbi:Y4yA family PLP-dependent enzyme [Hoyosella rhizosphaerae]|nr:Y4yA family PLP-dependent enzyme [Hoyosella rhizosphaerae]
MIIIVIMQTSAPLYLDPSLTTALADTVCQQELLHTLVTALGSPLNVVLPDQAVANAQQFYGLLDRLRLRGEVYFAHKANRSTAFLRRLAASKTRIDIASIGELQHALGCGFHPERIMATGPKTPEFLWLAARAGAIVNVDSLDELSTLAKLPAYLGPTRVLLRFSSFTASGTVAARTSRFGMAETDLGACLDVADAFRDRLDIRGVAYHLDTVGVTEKAAALDGCIRMLLEIQRRSHNADVIDIGGGFGVNYLEDSQQWDNWTSELTQAVLGHRDPITWRGHGYGLRAEQGRLKGALSLYPAHRPVAGPRYAEELLVQRSPSLGQRYSDILLETLTQVYMEPGRALVDQAGLVLTRVLEVRQTAGETLIRLDLNHSDVSLEEHGVVMDPMVIPRGGEQHGPGAGYLIGNLCLEADLISRRKIYFRSMPRPGDLLAFVNTAGYFMDFSADHALHQPIARTVALTGDRWTLDDQYWPMNRETEVA